MIVVLKSTLNNLSPSSRGRGSKQCQRSDAEGHRQVALLRGRGSKHLRPAIDEAIAGRPLTGAWIETTISIGATPTSSVALSRGRGSKQEHQHRVRRGRKSPSHGGVDRNKVVGDRIVERGSRPLTGAWIETGSCAGRSTTVKSPSHGGVDRNKSLRRHLGTLGSRPLTGAWIETTRCAQSPLPRWSPSHGGVDRNSSLSQIMAQNPGRPLTGAWIETWMRSAPSVISAVALSRGRGSKQEMTWRWNHRTMSPSHGGLDRNPDDVALPQHGLVALSRGRGSKLHQDRGLEFRRSRPLTGAWIETRASAQSIMPPSSPSHGGVDRNDEMAAGGNIFRVALSRGRGSKHRQ